MNAIASIASNLIANPVREDWQNPRGGPPTKVKVGAVFGLWTVLAYVPGRRSAGEDVKPRYTCRCKCGTVRDVIGSSLLLKRSLSCGCRTGRSRIPAGRSS